MNVPSIEKKVGCFCEGRGLFRSVRVCIHAGLLTLSIGTWLLLESEVADLFAISVMLLVAAVAVIHVARRSLSTAAWIVLCVASAVSVLWIFVALHLTRNEAERFARQFIDAASCRVSFAELDSRGQGWSYISSHMMVKNITRYGATRSLTYRDNGLFRYEYFDDEAGAVWLPPCAGSRSPG